MFLCERDLSKECKGNYKDCTDCVLDKIRVELNFLHNGCGLFNDGIDASLEIIDKYRKGEQKMTREEFKAKAKEVVDNEPFGDSEVLFDYESFVEMRVAYIPDGLGSSDADMPLDEFLDKLYEKIKNMALEPSADCVSRKAIVEMLNSRGQNSVMTFDHFIELLYKLPPVTPTQRWIPCSENGDENNGKI